MVTEYTKKDIPYNEEELKAVKMACKCAKGWPIPYDDVCQIGIVGLLKARESFDPEKLAWNSWLYQAIRWELLDALPKHARIKLPAMIIGNIGTIMKAYEGCNSIEEMANKLVGQKNFPNYKIAYRWSEVYMSSKDTVETFKEAPKHYDVDHSKSDMINCLTEELNKAGMDKVKFHKNMIGRTKIPTGSLSDKDLYIIKHYFGIGTRKKLLDELAKEFKVARPAINNRKNKALRILKERMMKYNN